MEMWGHIRVRHPADVRRAGVYPSFAGTRWRVVLPFAATRVIEPPLGPMMWRARLIALFSVLKYDRLPNAGPLTAKPELVFSTRYSAPPSFSAGRAWERSRQKPES